MRLSIGITCHPGLGGSGIVATEVGTALAARGHRVHFVCADVPRRLDLQADNVWFHRVSARDYPVFPQPPHALALASAMVAVARSEALDVLHVHYAVPHAASAWMAREILGGGPRLITTLHGTDVTLVGPDTDYLSVTRHAVASSDAVTAPSAFLRRAAGDQLGLDLQQVPIEVIPNFVDTDAYRPAEGTARPRLEAMFGPSLGDAPVLVHVSNLRPVKRAELVVEAFARVVARRPARLLLIGDGPERGRVQALLRQHGLQDQARLPGSLSQVADVLRECSAFLLPSDSEGFGLAALEALASGVPVVASAVGGLPEVIRDGQTGALVPPGDGPALARATLAILDDPRRRDAMSRAARADVLARFRLAPAVDRYEALYARLLAQGALRGMG